jgi:hypothetical protein
MAKSTFCKALAGLWGFFLVALFGLLVLQGMGGKYTDEELKQAWAWAIPLVTPGAALILPAWLSPGGKKNEGVSSGLAWLCLLLAFAYLAAVFAVPIYQPLSGRPPLPYMASAGIWLGGIQAAILAILTKSLAPASH